ncbi:MAG: cbb3-type cytochrome c oxidase subunit 3 [Gammaproteobacteria bacterium]|nr:cbb3-type cytochrome c oxidase subunit 3 [Gammaproteobacteria bacterium]
MDIPSLWGVITLLLTVAFVIFVIWAWSGKRKKGFEEAANLPFADEAEQRNDETRPENKETKP